MDNTTISKILWKLYKDEKGDVVILDGENVLIERMAAEFTDYHKSTPRHKYHEISKFIIDITKEDKEFQSVEGIVNNVKVISVYLNNKKPADRKLIEFLDKLEDHLQLEKLRWELINEKNSSLDQAVKDAEKQTADIVDKQNLIDDAVEDAKERSKNMYMQIVSILGIFTAIVFGVFGGVKAIESVGTVIAQPDVNVCHIVIAATLIMLFVIWVIYLLFACIRGLMEKEVTMPKINCAVWWISGGCIIMIIVAMFIVHF